MEICLRLLLKCLNIKLVVIDLRDLVYKIIKIKPILKAIPH